MRQVYHVSYRLVFQMGRKKSPKKNGSSHGGQNIGKFTADQMARCLAEMLEKKQVQCGHRSSDMKGRSRLPSFPLETLLETFSFSSPPPPHLCSPCSTL